MAVRNLKGAKTIGVNPELLEFPLYGDKPKVRGLLPGSIIGNTALGTLLYGTAEQRIGSPDPTWVKVVFREVDGENLLVIAAVKPPADPKKPGPDIYPLKLQAKGKTPAPVIRGLKRLFVTAGLQMRPDVAYEVEMELGEDEEGPVVCGSWTKATLQPIEPKAEGQAKSGQQTSNSEAAAGEQK